MCAEQTKEKEREKEREKEKEKETMMEEEAMVTVLQQQKMEEEEQDPNTWCLPLTQTAAGVGRVLVVLMEALRLLPHYCRQCHPM